MSLLIEDIEVSYHVTINLLVSDQVIVSAQI